MATEMARAREPAFYDGRPYDSRVHDGRAYDGGASAPVISLPTLREVLAVAFRRKLALALALALPVAAALAAASQMTVKYQADTKVLVRSGREYMPQGVIGGGGGEMGPTTTMLDTINTEIEILTSDDLTREVLRKETIERLYPRLAAAPPGALPTEDAAVKAFQADLSVAPVRLSNVIAIGLRSYDPEVATETLRLLLAGFQQRHVEAFGTNHSLLLNGQLQDQIVRLSALEKERAAYMAAAGLHSVAEQRTSLIQQRARHMQDLQDAELQQKTLTEEVAFLNNELAGQPARITTQTSTRESEVAQDNQRRLRDAQQQERELLARYPAGSRLMGGVEAGLGAVRQFAAQTSPRTSVVEMGINPIFSGLQSRLIAARVELAPLVSRIALLRAAAAEDDARLNHLSDAEVRLADLDRQITQLDSASSMLHQRLEDAHYLDDLDRAKVASLKVIEQPVALGKPVFPSRRLFLASGVAVGLVLDGLLLLLGLTFNVRVLVGDTVERVLGVPVVAALPAIPRRQMRRAASLARPEAALVPADMAAAEL